MNEISFDQRITCSVKQAIQASSLSRTTIYEATKAGHITSTRVAGRRLIFVQSLLEFLKSETEQEARAA